MDVTKYIFSDIRNADCFMKQQNRICLHPIAEISHCPNKNKFRIDKTSIPSRIIEEGKREKARQKRARTFS